MTIDRVSMVDNIYSSYVYKMVCCRVRNIWRDDVFVSGNTSILIMSLKAANDKRFEKY